MKNDLVCHYKRVGGISYGILDRQSYLNQNGIMPVRCDHAHWRLNMTLLVERVDEEVTPAELGKMGSFNHGYLQLKIGACFLKLPNFTPSSELRA